MDDWLLVLLAGLLGGFLGIRILGSLAFYHLPLLILSALFDIGTYKNHQDIPTSKFWRVLYGVVCLIVEFMLLTILLLMLSEIIKMIGEIL
ncbi:hypothetical protein PVA45_05105 [Entomospira entomophila]|uniref:Uncharacterized protein n=1 Tax=Entomospira entomophila TaxID=2719988 RepID=A0A968KTY7_9SPIO|nr:hypothetical protein [Entomospira entomophilus]NIZ40876.1 hypothetical protein [Entomospira entomophilus]WDI35089.1 hypothetical protein PVA45_05105 [Entomospira entomophilus]